MHGGMDELGSQQKKMASEEQPLEYAIFFMLSADIAEI